MHLCGRDAQWLLTLGTDGSLSWWDAVSMILIARFGTNGRDHQLIDEFTLLPTGADNTLRIAAVATRTAQRIESEGSLGRLMVVELSPPLPGTTEACSWRCLFETEVQTGSCCVLHPPLGPDLRHRSGGKMKEDLNLDNGKVRGLLRFSVCSEQCHTAA